VGNQGDVVLTGLINTLKRLKASADRMNKKTIILIQADPISPHYKSVQILDACAAAELKFVSFSNL